MNYAVVLYMEDEKTAMVEALIGRLAPICGSDYSLGIKPHISISALIAADEEVVKENAYRLSQRLKKGEVR